jgi:hypothetical protein
MKTHKILVGVASLMLVASSTAFAAGPATVNLGTASDYAILTKTGITTTGATSVVGDMGVSPIAASAITGFALTLPAASSFSTSALVTGKVYASDYAAPTPANLSTSISDMQTAYTDAMGRTNPTATELGAGNIGGMTLAPGLYKWGTSLDIPTDLTLSGGANDVWILQVAQNLNISSATKVVLTGGAQAGNVFWVVAGQATIGTTADFKGTILGQTAIALNTGAKLTGRALAQTAVTLDANTVVLAKATSASSAPADSGSGSGSTGSGSTSSGSSSGSAQTTTTQPDQAQINALQATLSSLQAQVQNQMSMQAGQGSVSMGSGVKAIATNLYEGSRGTDVTVLQNFLISQNKGMSAKALSTVGATAYFGKLTRAALAEYQA